MELNDTPFKEDKKKFIKGFLDQHGKYLISKLDQMPSRWNSWHLRRCIRDTIKCYSLSESEEKDYQEYLFWVSNDLKSRWQFQYFSEQKKLHKILCNSENGNPIYNGQIIYLIPKRKWTSFSRWYCLFPRQANDQLDFDSNAVFTHHMDAIKFIKSKESVWGRIRSLFN